MGFSYEREHNESWLEKRVEFMMTHTALSLQNQTDQDFEWKIYSREKTYDFIYDKLIQYDMSKLKWDLIEFGDADDEIIRKNNPGDELILVRLNSDDLYHSSFINLIRQFIVKPGTEALVFQKGYMWYQKEKVIVERHFPSPPFYGLIYDYNEFKEGKRYDFPGHNYIRSSLQSHAIKERLWLWVINEYNNKIMRGSSYPDPEQFEKADFSILKEFGI